MKSCALIGPRPKSFSFGCQEEHADCIRLKAVLREQIERLYEAGFRRFLTGCATGVDMWAGEIVADLMKRHADIELVCVVPFEQQPVYWSVRDSERYYALLAACTKIVLIHPRYTPNCYAKRNNYMAEHADILLAVYDPRGNRRSGTAMAVGYARARGVPVIAIRPDTYEATPDLRLLRPEKSAHPPTDA